MKSCTGTPPHAQKNPKKCCQSVAHNASSAGAYERVASQNRGARDRYLRKLAWSVPDNLLNTESWHAWHGDWSSAFNWLSADIIASWGHGVAAPGQLLSGAYFGRAAVPFSESFAIANAQKLVAM